MKGVISQSKNNMNITKVISDIDNITLVADIRHFSLTDNHYFPPINLQEW